MACSGRTPADSFFCAATVWPAGAQEPAVQFGAPRPRRPQRNFSRRWSKRSPSVYFRRPSGLLEAPAGASGSARTSCLTLSRRNRVLSEASERRQITHSVTFLTTTAENYSPLSGEPAPKIPHEVSPTGGAHGECQIAIVSVAMKDQLAIAVFPSRRPVKNI